MNICTLLLVLTSRTGALTSTVVPACHLRVHAPPSIDRAALIRCTSARYTSVTSVTTVTPITPVTSFTLQVIVQRSSGAIVRTFPALINVNGDLIFRDQHIDIFSRIAFPFSYMVALFILFASS